jgi:hypothetical protein
MDSPRRPAFVALAVAAAFVVFFFASKHRFGEVNPFAEDPYDAVGSFGIQLAAVAALAAWLRVVRPYPRPGAPRQAHQMALLFVDFLGLVRQGASPRSRFGADCAKGPNPTLRDNQRGTV